MMRRTVGAAAGALVMGLVGLGAIGCGGGEPAAAPSPEARVITTTSHDMAAMAMGSMDMGTPESGADPKVRCAQHMPGDLLTAAEAMVMFDTEHVCLGYVTVTEGTGVTWHNLDTVSRRVTVSDDDGAEVLAFDVPSMGAVTRSIDVAGVYRYGVSAIDTFVGTLEVQEP